MNRFFTFLVLLLSLTLCVSSCQKNDPTPLSVPSVTADASSHSLTVSWTPVSGAPEAVVDADVKNIGENAADLVFTVDENTCGYFYRLYTKAAYDETVADAPSFGYENPLDYVRDLTAAGGSMDYRSQTDSRSSLKVATDYVLVCFPYNVNGTHGYGPSIVKNFTTSSPAGAPAGVSSSASDENQTVNRRAEIRKLFK